MHTVEKFDPVRRVEDKVEVLELDGRGNVAVDLVEVIAPLGGLAPHRLVGVQPAPARVLLQTVHEVVDIRVATANGVLMIQDDEIQTKIYVVIQ